MRQNTAPTCLAIRVITGCTLIGTLLFFVLAFTTHISLLIPFAILVIVIAGCYAFAPVGYELNGSTLTVRYNLGGKVFNDVTECRLQHEKAGMSLRLFGNGGLFAGTGIFWNRQFGIFRAYVTSSRKEDLVVVKAGEKTVVISPESPFRFVEEFSASTSE